MFWFLDVKKRKKEKRQKKVGTTADERGFLRHTMRVANGKARVVIANQRYEREALKPVGGNISLDPHPCGEG